MIITKTRRQILALALMLCVLPMGRAFAADGDVIAPAAPSPLPYDCVAQNKTSLQVVYSQDSIIINGVSYQILPNKSQDLAGFECFNPEANPPAVMVQINNQDLSSIEMNGQRFLCVPTSHKDASKDAK